MQLTFDVFKGIAPKISPYRLPNGVAQSADNCILSSGALRPWYMQEQITTVPTSNSKFIYNHPIHGWYSDPESGDMIQSPVSADAWGRIYFFSDATSPTRAPVYYTSDDYSTAYTLGLPSPASAPATTAVPIAVHNPATIYAKGALVLNAALCYSCNRDGVTGAFAAADWTQVMPTMYESRSYVLTYVSRYGEESAPSIASNILMIAPLQSVTVILPGMPTGNYNITQKRIYRTNTGSDGSTAFQYLDTVDIAASSYLDNTPNSALGEMLPSVEWLPPPTGLHGAVILPGGVIAAFSGKDVYFSVPYMPHAWATSSRMTMADKVVALGAYGNSLLVTTEGLPYVVTGSSMEKLEQGFACVSKRSLVDMGYTCIYACPNGLMMAGTGSIKLITDGLFSQTEWRNYCDPSTIHAYQYDTRYIAFHSQGAFVFDPTTLDFTPLTVTANAGFYDAKLGDLYLCDGVNVRRWNSGVGLYEYMWRSGVRTVPKPVNFSFGQVVADDYNNVTLSLYADCKLKLCKKVANSNPFRLPGGFLADRWEIKLSGTSTVQSVFIANSVEELGSV